MIPFVGAGHTIIWGYVRPLPVPGNAPLEILFLGARYAIPASETDANLYSDPLHLCERVAF